ncbi:MAG: PD-(D/E)XK nuclease family protein [Phycisphaerales bacterium]|nr:PD-(D/E)XK nuclease family protein [Phycisphaerales bacterium]
MGVLPVYLGWDEPLLTTAVSWLLDQYQLRSRAEAAFKDQVDFSNLLLVVPGRRFGTRLREALMLACDDRDQGLIQPRILTPGGFADLACGAHATALPQLHREILVGQAAASMVREDPESLRDLMLQVPELDASRNWTQLGATLLQLRDELAGGGWDVDHELWSDDARRLIAEGQEAKRWDVIRKIMVAYDASLSQLDLVDPAQLRLQALRSGTLNLDDNDIVLIGVTDPPMLLRRMIEIVSENNQVYSLICAPESQAAQGSFDDLGAVDAQWWSQCDLEINDDVITVADDVAEVGQSLLRIISDWDGAYSGSEITVGVAEGSLLGTVRETLAAAGAPVRYAGGKPLRQSAVITVLERAGSYCESREFDAFASLIRHPDIAQVAEIDQLDLAAADAYHTNHLPLRVPGSEVGDWLWEETEWGGPCGSGQERASRLTEMNARLTEVLVDISSDTPLPIAQGMTCVRAFLCRVYGERSFDQAKPNDRMHLSMLNQLNSAIDLLLQAPDAVQEALGVMPIFKHIETLILAIEQVKVPEVPDSEAIELTDWLELSLDEAPALILVGLNEGSVPRSEAAHPFLPDTLRGALGLEHNASRAARDAHAIQALLQSRKDGASVRFVVPRRAANGDPLSPSRFLFQTSDAKFAARRVGWLTGAGKDHLAQGVALHPSFAGSVGAGIERVQPKGNPQSKKSISVTAFRKYMACPYRYWLQYVQGIQQLDDSDQEMNAASFGSLVHGVLQDYGTDTKLRDLDNTELVIDAFNKLLDERAINMFGDHAQASIYVQIEQARSRLHTFAQKQVDRFQAGWRILHAEFRVSGRDHPVAMEVGSDVVHIHGRIDRIDYHEATGALGIFDYKTGSTLPEAAHRRGLANAKQWIDLQLPLYRHLAHRLDVNWKTLELGYAMLPPDPDKSGFVVAQWDEQALSEADLVAVRIAKDIHQGIFWPPTEPAPPYTSEFSAICQDAVLNASPIGDMA